MASSDSSGASSPPGGQPSTAASILPVTSHAKGSRPAEGSTGAASVHAAHMDSRNNQTPQRSEISFFKNGICQGTAFTDLFGRRYYPAASMYTLPNQPNCEVRFNFGPEFQSFPEDFGGRPAPKPMIEAPYHGYGNKVEGPSGNEITDKQANGASS